MVIAAIGPVADVVANATIAVDWGNATAASSVGRVVHRFNSTAERDSAIPAPTAGMVCYVSATAALMVYTAGRWVGIPSGTPAALAAASPFTAWTDPAGDVWVAKGGVNGGAWKRARDALHSSVWRNAAYTCPIADTAVPYDTVRNDPFGIWVPASNGFVVPVAGVWQIRGSVFYNATAGAVLATNIVRNGAFLFDSQQSAGGTQAVTGSIIAVINAAAGDLLQISTFTSPATALYIAAGRTGTYATCDYQGSG